MPETYKKLLLAAGNTLLILIFGGGLVFFLSIFAFLGLVPLYAAKAVPVVGGAGILALILATSGYIGQKGRRRVGIGFLCVLAAAAVFIANGLYKDSLPALDDLEGLLWQYDPFDPNTKSVTLEEPSTLKFDTETAQAIRLDGATALYPVYASFVQNVWPEDAETGRYDHRTVDGYGSVACSGTIEAYERLIKGKTDMIFAAAPSQAQLDAAKAAGVELHMTPIGREAFVFFVNSRNPVENLTVAQIQGIYSGRITNWKEVGGKNQRIRPFQRAENSGSQSALRRLMEGLPLLEPEEEDRIGGMGGIIREVASYRNYKNAIGFSFRFYSTEMVQNGDIRLLALNGVEPTKETIRDGSYPISSESYAITVSPTGEPAPQETNGDLASFLDWMASPQGQSIVEQVGYVSLG